VKSITNNVTKQRDIFADFGEPDRRGFENGNETWTYSYLYYEMGQLRESEELYVAPIALRGHFVSCIRKEAEHARAGQPARIIAKVNSLIDPAVIDELYSASEAAVQIDLIVRGMCSLRPGIPGVSERIRVVAIIDRYLEHARVFYFHNGGDPSYWLASADWMQRNFDRRVEIAFPVLDAQHQARLKEILEIQLSDTCRGGRYRLTGPR
jgi:polyphosphate kinase